MVSGVDNTQSLLKQSSQTYIKPMLKSHDIRHDISFIKKQHIGKNTCDYHVPCNITVCFLSRT